MPSGLKLPVPFSLSSLISFLIILQLAFIVIPGKAHASSLSLEEIGVDPIRGISQNGNIVVGSKYIDGNYYLFEKYRIEYNNEQLCILFILNVFRSKSEIQIFST